MPDNNDFVTEQWRPPNTPNVKQDFNDAAKQQAKKEVPFASEGGISTKTEVEKRTEIEKVLRERLQRENAPAPQPLQKDIVQQKAEEKRLQIEKELKQNNDIKDRIQKRLDEKKKEQMNREFNRSAGLER